MKARFLRWGWLLALLLLLISKAPRLLAAAANNAAARTLVLEWQVVVGETGVPACRRWMETSRATSALALALRLDETFLPAHVNEGRAAWLAGDCARAQAAWVEVLQEDPANEIAALWAFLASGGDVEVVPLAAQRQGLAIYAFQMGQRAQAEGVETQARHWYELSLDLHAGRQATAALAALYRRAGDEQGAIRLWEELAVALPANDPDHWWALGQAAALAQEWEQAALAYRQGAALATAPWGFWVQEGIAWTSLQRWEEAQAAYERVLQSRPDLATGYLQMGHLRRAQGDAEGALAWYQRAVTVSQGSADALYWEGVGHYLLQQYEQAEERFNQVLAANEEHVWAHYYLAQTLYQQGRTVEATEHLGQAVRLHPGRLWRWAVQLGDWRLEVGDREGALAAYRQALEWQPGEASVEERIERLGEIR